MKLIHQVLEVRCVNNLRKLKKYVDEAIEKGADTIHFNFQDEENKKAKAQYEKLMLDKTNVKYKEHTFRCNRWISINDVMNKVKDFCIKNNINDYSFENKQMVTDEHDDYDDSKQTIFIREKINQ